MLEEIIAQSNTPYARGDADRYYGRGYNPHKRDGSGRKIYDLTEDEIAEYERGFEENPCGGKDWGE